MALKLTEQDLRARLRRIHAIATGRVAYPTDFGRVCSIERLSDVHRRVSEVELRPARKKR